MFLRVPQKLYFAQYRLFVIEVESRIPYIIREKEIFLW